MSRQVHIAFTEAMLGIQTMRCNDADDLINELNALEGAQVTLEDQLVKSNMFLSKLGRNITKQRDVRTEEWILVASSRNTAPDANKGGLSEEKVDKLLNSLFVKDRYYVVKPKVLATGTLTEQDVELFFTEGYLEQTADGRVYPSTKLLLDASKHVENKYSDSVQPCAGCKKPVIFGVFCSDHACSFRVHRRCREPYFQKMGLEADKCAECSAELEQPNNDSAVEAQEA